MEWVLYIGGLVAGVGFLVWRRIRQAKALKKQIGGLAVALSEIRPGSSNSSESPRP